MDNLPAISHNFAMFSSQKETITQNKNNVISKQMEIGTGCEYLSSHKKAKKIVEKQQQQKRNKLQ